MATGIHRGFPGYPAGRDHVCHARRRTGGRNPRRSTSSRATTFRRSWTHISISSKRSAGSSESHRGRFIARCAATASIVSLEGHGGDELLGGYGLHIHAGPAARPQFHRLRPPHARSDQHAAPYVQRADTLSDPAARSVLAALTIPRVRAVARRLLRGQPAVLERPCGDTRSIRLL